MEVVLVVMTMEVVRMEAVIVEEGGGRGGKVGGGTVGGGGRGDKDGKGGEVGGDKNLSESVIGEGNAEEASHVGQHCSPEQVASNAFSICKSHFLLTYHVKLEIFLPLGKKKTYSRTKQNHTKEGTNFTYLREMKKKSQNH